MPAEGRENPLLKKGNSDAFFREKYLTKNTYGYDAYGRLSEKKFPNGTESAYAYDSKGQLMELVHRNEQGTLDRYAYLYDLTGNKTGITKERRGLPEESGVYSYGYDALGRLSEIQKDGRMQTRYGYDAFGNRVLKEDRTGRTAYRHNALNQLVSEIRQEGSGEAAFRKTYQYDKRGNLTRITENGQTTHRYVLLSRKLNDALSSRLFYAHFDSHRDISHFKSSCFCELFF